MKKILFGILALSIIAGCGFTTPTPPEQQLPDTLSVGVILPLTGSGAYVGSEMQKGLALAANDFNRTNTDRSVSLYMEDSATNPKTGLLAFQTLEKTIHPDAYISALDDISMAVAPATAEAKVPLVATVATAPAFTEQGEQVYRYYATGKTEVTVIDTILRQLHSQHVGLLYLNDDLGNTILEELKTISASKRTITAESFLSDETNFTTALTKLSNAGIDTLFAAGLDAHLKNIVKTRQELGLKVQLVGISTLSLPTMREEVGTLLEGARMPAPIFYDASYAYANSFKTAYQKNYRGTPSHYSAVAYDTLMLLANSLGTNPSTREEIARALTSTSSVRGLLGDVPREGNEFNIPLWPAQVQNNGVLYVLD